MPYVINRWNGTPIVTVEDGTVTQTLDVKLIGKNFAGYGEIQNENFVHLLENFAGAQSPSNAISGQIWYDSQSKKLKFHTGDQVAGVKIWKTAGGVEYGNEPPNSVPGDLWYDIGSNQLKIRQSNGWSVIGPQAAGAGLTQMRSRIILGRAPGVGSGSPATAYSIIVATINDDVVYVISNAEFTIADPGTGPGGVNDPDNFILGFNVIKRGLTLPNTNSTTGAPTGGAGAYVYWGTAALSKGLLESDGTYVPADTVISEVRPDFKGTNQSVTFNDIGLKVGEGDDLHILIEGGTQPAFRNLTGDTLTFKVNDGGQTPATIQIKGKTLLPATDNLYSLGSLQFKWANVHATTFTGLAASASALFYSAAPSSQNNLVAVTESDTAWSIPVRDANRAITAALFNGDALRARYADLAEKYLADKEYPTGTVVSVGGEKEVTACQNSDRAIGVVSANPAFEMNSQLEGGTYIALKGRVPTMVEGMVKKGDRLIASTNGCARVAQPNEIFNMFAIALESNNDIGIKLVESLIL